MTSRGRLTLLALAALVASLGVLTSPAAAATPCWKRLVNDWYDGRIDKAYPVSCYRAAIKNLPEDVEAYSDARDDINRALLAAFRRSGKKSLGPQEVIPPPPRATPPKTTTTEPDGTTTGGETETAAAPPPGRDDDGGGLIDVITPSNADSIPLPLLVLAGLALFLLALAAGGFVTRRIQARRLRLDPRPPEQP